MTTGAGEDTEKLRASSQKFFRIIHLESAMKTSSSDTAEADGGARVLFTGEFCSDTKRDGVSSLSGDSLLTVTLIKGKLKKMTINNLQ